MMKKSDKIAFWIFEAVFSLNLALWIISDLTADNKFQIQERYDIFLLIGLVAMFFVLIMLPRIWKKYRLPAYIGMISIILCSVWAGLPRL